MSKSHSVLPAIGPILAVALAAVSWDARADEGGVSFWLPGQYGSLAAIAPEPGFSLPTSSYFYSGALGGSRTLQQGGRLTAGADADFFGQLVIPTYTLDTSFLGARPSFSLAMLAAYNRTSAEVSIGALSAGRTDTVGGFGDLYPTAQLFWNAGVHNWMAYVTGDIPVGAYDPDRLANLGIGHAAIDFGGAYTYLDPTTGLEFSATAGLTYNFENPDTDYRNGVDFHLDWGVSQFLSEQLHVGLVGYSYYQLSGDSGAGARLGAFKSQVFGIGPQVGYMFLVGGRPAYLNLKGYHEFGAKNRTEGWNAWLTLALPI